MKKMKFNESKSQIMVIAKTEKNIELKLNNSQIPITKVYTYLGDEFNNKNTYEDMIKTRKNKARQTTREILSTCRNAIFKEKEIEVGLKLMKTILIPRLIHNSETWTNITKTLICELEKEQSYYLKRLLHLPDSTPTIGVLYECGIIPIEELLWSKKLRYYQKLLKTNNKTIIEIIKTQTEMKLPRCWITEMKQYLEQNNINNTEEEIKRMTVNTWKRIVNKNTAERLKQKLSKEKSTKTMFITECKEQKYLKMLDSKDSRLAIRIRLKMIDTTKYMKSKYEEDKCRLCLKEKEDILHILMCEKNEIKYDKQQATRIIYNLHSDETIYIAESSNIIDSIMKRRKNQEQTNATTSLST